MLQTQHKYYHFSENPDSGKPLCEIDECSHKSNPDVIEGFHSVIARTFGNPEVSDTKALALESRRSGHSADKGKRMHACAQHSAVCERQPCYALEHGSKKSGRCPDCTHPYACRALNCKSIRRTTAAWLSSHDLIGVMVEAPIFWHRQRIASRCDLLSVRLLDLEWWDASLGKLPPLVVVSIKTLGKNGLPPQSRKGSSRCVRIPPAITQDPVPDGEDARHQLQLMMEAVVLRDTYDVDVVDAHILYISDRGSLCVGSSTACKSVEKADWWWKSVTQSAYPPFQVLSTLIQKR